MRLVRSWPKTVPAGRAHVVDDIEHLDMDDYDYRVLDQIDDDIVLLEWDIAVGGTELATFIDRCHDRPDQPRVAPYKLYVLSSTNPHQRLRDTPVWAHRVHNGKHSMRHVVPEDDHCDFFGFGFVYLPRMLVHKFMEWLPDDQQFNDTSFSTWHYYYAPNPQVPIHWDVPIVHLHYPLPQL